MQKLFNVLSQSQAKETFLVDSMHMGSRDDLQDVISSADQLHLLAL
jgi:hypothetical protein